jgi:hypothetical protein
MNCEMAVCKSRLQTSPTDLPKMFLLHLVHHYHGSGYYYINRQLQTIILLYHFSRFDYFLIYPFERMHNLISCLSQYLKSYQEYSIFATCFFILIY